MQNDNLEHFLEIFFRIYEKLLAIFEPAYVFSHFFPGLYLILATCCTFDMKKCLVSIRKNGKDVANIFDQDGDQNKVRKSKQGSA